ncbi:MAG: hypothetical protein E5X68_19860 [Mesorhizobium sp.]|uniref:hypothetical protein n=1 Tax=Mesorhizobium sp. TaxID=1871066 RepID=UPI000FE3CC01|nr:hypothetical protein [Mesorhizobium sp.]RWL24891.1 MAG: hypothetical protein EOR58_22160 [Mesorhizobium sp.]RWL27178.1 MAG: hypothetical protein EOR63_22710 [Mesorhizobium sp.]RWL31467.1 MAG: hypothetical protein EOR59_27690 [Mesorhizobium sp.]RWL66865.1 MAG: hypothetical protein EOR65_26080 [Mesorhizobium sp.]TIO97038.1 MAG: hypothetical protein E5X71_11075 [Mesorhizobium sp.]
MRASRGGCGLVLRALTALALVVAPFSLSVDGVVVTKAYAGKGGNGGGNSGGNGGGNGSGNSGGNGGGNSGNGNSGGNSGNGNSGGNSGNSNSNSSGNNSSSNSAGGASAADADSHVNAATGDKVEATAGSIQVTHRNGMKETIENGRFRMEDKYGRTIVDRKATMADLNRLNSL